MRASQVGASPEAPKSLSLSYMSKGRFHEKFDEFHFAEKYLQAQEKLKKAQQAQENFRTESNKNRKRDP